MRLDGTALERLTDDPAYDDQPAISPDGKTVAFVSSRGSGHAHVWLLDVGTRAVRQLTQSSGGDFRPSWSPDGQWIAFSSDRDSHPGPVPGRWEALQSTGVYIVRRGGSGLRRLTPPGGFAGTPKWSADGKRIIYKKDQHLVIYSIVDGTRADLTQPGTQDDNFPQWSPNGERIAFTSNRDGDYEIYTIRPDGTDLRRLTRSPGNDAHGIWSPDGEWILFSSARMGFKDERPLAERIPQPYGELFVMRADGSQVRQLTDNQWEDATPGWAPSLVVGRQSLVVSR